MTPLAVTGLAVLLAAITTYILRMLAADRHTATAEQAATHIGRHHADTVGWMPESWMPPTGDRRIAALTEHTREMDVISA